MAKPHGHDDWQSIEDVVVAGKHGVWTGYLKVQGGWLVKSVLIDHGEGQEPHSMSITFVPDPEHLNAPTCVE